MIIPIAFRLRRANKLFPLRRWNVFFVSGLLVIFCSIFVRLGVSVGSVQTPIDISYSTSTTQICLSLNRFSQLEGLKNKKAMLLLTHFINNTSTRFFASDYVDAGVFYALNIVYRCNAQQAFMLLDRPPPFAISPLL